MQVNRQQFVAIGDMPANFGVDLLRDTCYSRRRSRSKGTKQFIASWRA